MLSLVVLKVSPSITFKQLNQRTITLLYVCMGDPLPLMCSLVRQWPHFDVIGGTLQRKKKKAKICSHPPKSDPLALQSHHQRAFNVFQVTSETIPPIYLQGFFLEAGQCGGGSSLIARLQHWVACATLLGYCLKRSRSQIASFRRFLQAWSVSPPSLDATLLNHLHPVDLTQRPKEEHSSHFLFPPSLSPPRSPASTVTIAIIRLS